LQDYPSDELLISYDPDFKYGQNFFLCTSEEAKNRFLHPEPDRSDSAVAAAGTGAGRSIATIMYIWILGVFNSSSHL